MPMTAESKLSPEPGSMAQFRKAILRNRASPGIAEQLCALGTAHMLAKGDAFPPCEKSDQLVFVADGAAKFIAEAEAAKTQVLAFQFAGDFVSVLRRRDGDFQLVALTELALVAFPAGPFLDLAQEEPTVLRSVLTRSLHALHRSRTKMLRLGHKSARQRIADFLVSMSERLGGRITGPCEITLPMTRKDIGDSLGLEIETVSRQFTDLRDGGLIETQGRSIVRITDLDALALEAGQIQKSEIHPQN